MTNRTVTAVVAVLAVSAGLASAHGWAIDANSQVVGDDTVVVEHVSMLESGYLAIHRDEPDENGSVLGSVYFDESGEHSNVRVPLGAAWDDVDGATELAAVVHRDDGDGTFEWPGDDGVHRPDDPIVETFTAKPADGKSAHLIGLRQETDGNVTLRRVDLPSEGFVVVYDEEDGEPGEIVGVRRLSSGHHENVTVSVAPRYYNSERSRLYLVAGVHRDDGDGEFEPAEDKVVTVGNSSVRSSFDAEKTRSTLPTPSPTPTATATPSLTESPSPTRTASPTPTMPTQPGFGLGAALVALAALAVLRLGRRWSATVRR